MTSIPSIAPKWRLLPSEDGGPARVKAVVDVRPDFELGQYRAIPVSASSVAISDTDVERALTSLARDKATLVPVDREARLGDIVTVDYEGTVDGTAFEGGAAKGQQTELSEGRFIPGFAAGIAGMREGETRSVKATFPTDYQKTDLAGKVANFSVTLHEVKEAELPALDDDFAKAVSQHETLEALKDDIRARLHAVAQSRRRREIGNQVVDLLIANHDFPLPQVLIGREIESMISDLHAMAERNGMSFEDYLTSAGKTVESVREEYADEARRRVKGMLILERIAKAENIKATPADIQAELQALAEQYGQPVERVRQALGNGVLSLMDGIVRNKTVELLIEQASVTDTKA